MDKPRILVVDDDEPIRTQMKWALVEDYDIFLATDGERAMDLMRNERPELVILDLGLPPDPEGTSEGLRILGEIVNIDGSVKVVVVTGNPDKTAALEAISRGAHDFFTKPIEIDELKYILKRAHYVHRLEVEYRELQKKLDSERFSEMVGNCPQMEEIFATVRKVATTDVPVLITGDSGTGKELVAKAIHTNSSRADGPFVPINCGAIPENLLESELFGHEKGAFTGAHVQRAGKIELADGGTLFLDEIGELPVQLQVKLLRFLQDYKIERVGGRQTMSIDVRIIAATNRDMDRLLTEEAFREDLYYRLAVVNIKLPQLHERGDDVLLLAKVFIKKFTPDGNMPKTLGEDAVSALYSYDWPGNIRELENRVRRAITLADGSVISAADIGLDASAAVASGESLDLRTARDEVEVRYIRKALEKNNGNISRSAEDLGLTRPTLHHLIKKHDLQK